jgi:hypothetical protein
LAQTIDGIISLSKELLSSGGFNYVLLGMFQSDELEKEFGVYRQMCGGCYYISVDQVLCSARLRKLRLLSGIRAPFAGSRHDDCCTSPLTDSDLEIIDGCVAEAKNISAKAQSVIYFICGYVAKKERIRCKQQPHQLYGEFSSLVSRGKLSYPPNWLFRFACLCFCVFDNLPLQPSCCNRLIKMFTLVFDSYFARFACNFSSVSRRLAQCFLKGLVNKCNEKARPPVGAIRTFRKLKKFAS